MKTLDDCIGLPNNLDAIRLVAAVGVLFSHAYLVANGVIAGEPFYVASGRQANFGQVCVAIFFMISGFLITQSFFRSPTLTQYMVNRILRIVPALAAVVVLTCFVLGPAMTSRSAMKYWADPLALGYLANAFVYPLQQALPGVFEENVYPDATNVSIWTLSYEFTCYLGVAVVGLLLRRAWLPFILMLGLTLAAIFVSNISTSIFLKLASYFLCGALAYAGRRWVPIDFRLFVLALMLLCAANFSHRGLFPALCVFGTYCILYLAYTPYLKVHGAAKYGDFSYGIYLYAWPVQQVMYPFTMNEPLMNALFSLPFVVILAAWSWFLIEKPAMARKKAVAAWVDAKSARFPRPMDSRIGGK